MARDKRERNMDQPARSALTGLAEALASVGLIEPVKREAGEFTVDEAAADCGKSPCTTRKRLRDLMAAGKVTRRHVTLNGVSGFYYRLKG